MSIHGISAIQAAAESMTMGERGIESAKVILTGFVVVFSVLLLLIGIIKLYSAIVSKLQSGGESRKKKDAAQKKKVVSVSRTVAAPEPQAEDGIPEEVVAVIAAAVMSLYAGASKPRIKSIKKAGGSRSAWANAGVIDNTRPF